jgi:hypothetical protein
MAREEVLGLAAAAAAAPFALTWPWAVRSISCRLLFFIP